MDQPSASSSNTQQQRVNCLLNRLDHLAAQQQRQVPRLLSKDIKIAWQQHTQDFFETLKQSLMSAPILSHFNPTQPIVIDTDASHFALAGIISHPNQQNN